MKNWPLQIPPDFDRRSNTSLITYISLQINVFYMYIQAKLGNDEFEPCLYLTSPAIHTYCLSVKVSNHVRISINIKSILLTYQIIKEKHHSVDQFGPEWISPFGYF